MKKFLSIFQVFLALALVFSATFFFVAGQDFQWETVWSYRKLFIQGWTTTILLSIASLLLSLCLGVMAALLKRSKIRIVALITKIYIELTRGTPLLVQILFFYYVVANSLGLENRFLAGVAIISIFHGAYIAEMVRGGIEAISSTQFDSARAIGLTTFQSYRFVIFPQAIRQILSPMAGQFASIIKDSSLLSIIGINEVTNSAQQINSATYSTLESYFPLAFIYLLLTLPISLWSKHLEKKYQYEA